jgi:hypothetical protein
MPTDFKALAKFDERARKAMVQELADAEWAAFGRTVHENLISERFVTALQTALLKGGPSKDVARRLTAFLLTGTITS